MDLVAVAWTVASVLVGGMITWVVAWWYYAKAGKELAVEAEALRKKSDLVLYCLTNRDAKITLATDDAGNITGLTVSATGTAGGVLKFRSSGTLHDAGSPPDNGPAS